MVVARIVSLGTYDAALSRRVVATQAFAGLVRDSAGVLVSEASDADPPVAVVDRASAAARGLPPASAPGADGLTDLSCIEWFDPTRAVLTAGSWVSCTFASSLFHCTIPYAVRYEDMFRTQDLFRDVACLWIEARVICR
jgi:hypothetical protein